MAVRLILVLSVERAPQPYAVNDEAVYYRIAVNLLEGRGFSASDGPPIRPTSVRTPGYPLFLALAFAPAGPSVRAGLVASALADSATALLLFFLVFQVGRSTVAALAVSAAWAFLSPALPLLEFLYSDALGAALVALAGLLSVRALRRAGPGHGLYAGLAWACAILVRPFLLPAAAAAALVQRRRTALALVAGAALVLLPWTFRNALVFRQFLPVSSGGVGMNLWVGTWCTTGPAMVLHPGPDGETRGIFPGPWADSPDEARRAVELWNAYMEAFLGEGGPEILEADRGLRRLALERIRHDPVRWIRLRLANAGRVWSLPQVTGGPWIGAVILLLGVVGAARLWSEGRRREVLVLALPVLVLAICLLPLRSLPRYAANIAPLVFALAAMALPAGRAPNDPSPPGEAPPAAGSED